MQQIHSETQRLVRDSPVSLPYHRPRQRTLVEFIQRGKLKSANRQLKPSLSVPTKKLNKVWKHLEEREKEAEGFYKAESEDSEKECETPKNEESQNQPIAAAECVVQCTQTPGIPLAEVEEEGSPQREVKNLDIYCDAAVINADTEKRECIGEISEVTKDRTGINVQISSCRSIDLHDFMLLGDESMNTSDIPSKNTVFSCEQMESKEKITVSNEGTSASNHAVDTAHSSSNNFFIGSYTQNFHLHYSESISLDNNNEDAIKTGKCILGSEVDREDSLDISLGRKGNNLIKEPTEIKESKDNSKKENIDSFQEDEKSNAEWYRNIKPLSDDSDNEERLTENRKVLSIEKHRFLSLEGIDKLQPRLSDAPSGIIDLDEDVAEKGGVTKFLQRIMKHSAAGVKSKPTRRTKEISVVSAEKNIEGLETVQKDVMTVTLEDDDPVEDPALKKPGAKLQRLKEELQRQMAQKRAEEWQKRQQEYKLDNEELGEVGELSDCGAKEEEIEEEMTDEVTDSTTETEDEDDIPVVEKKRKRSSFIDEEAEVSNEDGDEMSNEEEEESTTNNEEIDSEVGVCDELKQLMDPAEGNKEDLEQELLGQCSGKFTCVQRQDTEQLAPSPVISEKMSWRKAVVVSSDEEDERENLKNKSQRKGVHEKLAYSDEEDEEFILEEPAAKDSVEGDVEDGDNDGDDEDDDDGDGGGGGDGEYDDDGDGEKIVDYNSEENEVISTRHKLLKRKMTEYFEDEAELSETDWDSADEDEHGLNRLEKEEGDDDQLDQEVVKEQLGKIHMRRILDEDKREVRLLQEILLEDGELHSEDVGIERKFKWKNINNIDEIDLTRTDSDDDVSDGDEEHEAEWRRRRDEREAFLQKRKEMKRSNEVLLEDEDIRLLQLEKTLKRVRRSNSQDTAEKPTSSSAPQHSPDPKRPFQLLTKRGSFLARRKTALARITQRTGESLDVVSRPKTTRNFVFTALSPIKEEESSLEEKPAMATKRCSSESLPPVEKRFKVNDKKSKGKDLQHNSEK